MRPESFRALGPGGFHRVAYTAWGQAGGRRAVICAHGLTRNGRDFDTLAQALADKHLVACPDVAGRGASDWLADAAEYTYPVYLADMAALIAHLGVERVDWVGTSMGGLIGMMLAAQPGSPIRSLLVNDVGPFIPKAALERLADYVGLAPTFATAKDVEAYLRDVHAPFGPLTDAEWAHLTRHSAREDEPGRWALTYDPHIGDVFRAGPIDDVDLWPVWDAISCRTLVLRGAQSDLLPADVADAMTMRGPAAKLVEIPGVGHAPALMAADQLAIVRDWLDK